MTEFIHYMNQEYEPTTLEKKSEYSHISFTDKLQEAAKKHRRRIKKERK